jgi:DNA primase
MDVQNHTLTHLAEQYHQDLPARLRRYLNDRGIADAIIDRHLLGWNGWRITVPIPNRAGFVAFFKLAKDPADRSDTPKMLATAGASADLYGWEHVRQKPERLIICEGEFDRLVLESRGFAAVTSTGGALTFRPEWADALRAIANLYVCFDRDEAGRAGAAHVARLLPWVRVVELPEEVGERGDVTDFFVRLGRSRDDFERLVDAARPLPAADPGAVPASPASRGNDEEIARLKGAVSLETLAGAYVALRRSGRTYLGRCPFHEDHHPSFVIYPEQQTFHCYGCQAHGDILTFLMKVEHLTFPEALKLLRRL